MCQDPMSIRRVWIIAISAAFLIPGIVTFLYLFKPLSRTPIKPDVKPKQDTSLIKARELFYEGKHNEAEEAFKALLSVDPRNVKVLGSLGTLYYRQGNMELAMKYWNEALSISPDDAVLRGLVNSIKQKGKGNTALYHIGTNKETSEDSWETHYNIGQELYYKGNYQEAVSELKKSRDLKPDDSKIYFALGASYLKLKDRENTIKMWEKSLSLSPDDQMVRALLTKVKKRKNPSIKTEGISQ